MLRPVLWDGNRTEKLRFGRVATWCDLWQIWVERNGRAFCWDSCWDEVISVKPGKYSLRLQNDANETEADKVDTGWFHWSIQVLSPLCSELEKSEVNLFNVSSVNQHLNFQSWGALETIDVSLFPQNYVAMAGACFHGCKRRQDLRGTCLGFGSREAKAGKREFRCLRPCALVRKQSMAPASRRTHQGLLTTGWHWHFEVIKNWGKQKVKRKALKNWKKNWWLALSKMWFQNFLSRTSCSSGCLGRICSGHSECRRISQLRGIISAAIRIFS